MREECCRVCGVVMEPDTRCEICKNFIASHCPGCGNTSDSQIHIHQQ